MYIPPHFQQKDLQESLRMIRENSFATLVSQVNGRPWATHLPLLLQESSDGTLMLHGHLSRGNLQGRTLRDREGMMAIFQGPHAYVSSTWYTSQNVPTWNYAAVHVYGTVEILEVEALRASLAELVDTFEQYTGTGLSMNDLPEEYLARMIRGIYGIRMTVTELQAAHKLSQNRDKESYSNIVDQLGASPHEQERQTAELMKRLSPHDDQP